MPVFDPTSLEERVCNPLAKDTFHILTQESLEMLEEALRSLGEYGEVRLIVVKSQLRFVVKCSSQKVSTE